MSTESLDTTSEQIEGGPEQLVSEDSELMETKTAVGSENVGMDCVLRQEPVVRSPPSKQPEDGGVGVKMWTTHECECDNVHIACYVHCSGLHEAVFIFVSLQGVQMVKYVNQSHFPCFVAPCDPPYTP